MPEVPVAIVRCEAYEPDLVDAAVQECLALLPELSSALSSVSSLFLKVDLEDYRPSREATCTHPAVVAAVARRLKALGATVMVGDGASSSAWPMWRRIRRILLDKLRGRLRHRNYRDLTAVYDRVMGARLFQEALAIGVDGMPAPLLTVDEVGPDRKVDFYAKSGILDAVVESGAEAAYLELSEYVERELPEGTFLRRMPVARRVVEAGRVVAMPKVRLTESGAVRGAIHTMFGIVPTAVRTPYEKASRLSGLTQEMYVDVFRVVEPRPVAVSDAVLWRHDGREPWPARVIIAAVDCVAHDAVAAAVAGIDPMGIAALRVAHEAGLGTARLEDIEIRGVPLARAAPGGRHG